MTPALPDERPSPRRIAEAVGAIVLLLVVLVFVSTVVPQLALADHAYVVQTDSMSPAIEAGSVVYVSSAVPASIEPGDVITFEKGGDPDNRVTHRVVDVFRADGQRQFRTKGDANEEVDPVPVPAANVVGVVTLHLPLVGYVIAFAGTGPGMFLMVAVPAAILVVLEVRDLLWPAAGTGSDATDGGAPDGTPDSEVADGGE